jgi:hypothetical protein
MYVYNSQQPSVCPLGSVSLKVTMTGGMCEYKIVHFRNKIPENLLILLLHAWVRIKVSLFSHSFPRKRSIGTIAAISAFHSDHSSDRRRVLKVSKTVSMLVKEVEISNLSNHM